jgi:hypothetical protein
MLLRRVPTTEHHCKIEDSYVSDPLENRLIPITVSRPVTAVFSPIPYTHPQGERKIMLLFLPFCIQHTALDSAKSYYSRELLSNGLI